MNQTDTRDIDHQNRLSYPDKLWLVLYTDKDIENWSEPTEDRHEAEMAYDAAINDGLGAKFGFVCDGSISGRMRYKEVEKLFNESRI